MLQSGLMLPLMPCLCCYSRVPKHCRFLLSSLGERQAGLAEAFQHMNLWRIPHLEVETQTLLVYELTVNESAAAKAAAGDVTSQIEAIVPTIQV